jgi:hypothetical protein
MERLEVAATASLDATLTATGHMMPTGIKDKTPCKRSPQFERRPTVEVASCQRPFAGSCLMRTRVVGDCVVSGWRLSGLAGW